MLRKRAYSKLTQIERRMAKIPTSVYEYEEFGHKDIKIERNAEIIKQNLKKVITESIEHNVNTIAVSCGYILAPFLKAGVDEILIPGDSEIIKKKLATKLRFLSLLNFRRILNTIQGINEEFLDNLVVFKRDFPLLKYDNGVDLKTVVNAGIQYDFFEKASLSSKQFEFMRENTLQSFVEYMDKTNSELFLTDFQSDDKLRDHIRKRRLADGVVMHKDMEYQLKSKDTEIKMLKAVIKRRDLIIADMRGKLLKEIIHLREALFQKKKNKETDVYRVDYFEPTEVLDESVMKILNEKLSDMKTHYEAKIQALKSKLSSTESKLKYYLEMDSKDNPGYSSLLIKRGIKGLGDDYYLLWKVLQEILGREWFQKVFLERKDQKRYGIDYNAIDEIVGELNKIIIQNKPNLIGFLAGPNAAFVDCIVQTFSKQKKEAEEELYKRENLDRDLIYVLPDEKKILKKRQKLLMNSVNPVQVAKKSEDDQGSNNSGFEIEGLNEQDMIQTHSKLTITNSSSLNTHGKSLREKLESPIDLNYERVVLEGLSLEDIRKQNLKFKKRENMLLNELKNLQREKYSAKKRIYVLEKRYDQCVEFIRESMKKMKINWEGESFAKKLFKLKEVDGDALRRAGVDRAIKKGKTELLAKLVIHSTAHNSRIHKSTNTNTDQYTDLSKDSDLVLWVTAKLKRLKKREASYLSKSRMRSMSKSRTGKSSQYTMRSGLTSLRRKREKRKKTKKSSVSGIEEVRHNRSLEARRILDKSYDSKNDEVSEIITTENKSMIQVSPRKNIGLGGKSDMSIKKNKNKNGNERVYNSGEIKPSFEKTPSFNNPYEVDPDSQKEINTIESSINSEGGKNLTIQNTQSRFVKGKNGKNEDGKKTGNREKGAKSEKNNAKSQKSGKNDEVIFNNNRNSISTQKNKSQFSYNKKSEGTKNDISQNTNQNSVNNSSQNRTNPGYITSGTLSALNQTLLQNKTEDEFTLKNHNGDVEEIKKSFEKYMEKWEKKNKKKKIPNKEIERLINKAVRRFEKFKSMKRKKNLLMNLMNTVEITGRVEGDDQFIQATNFIPTGEIPLEDDESDYPGKGNPIIDALRMNKDSHTSIAITGRSNETEMRRNIEKAKREMMIRKLRELRMLDKKRFKIDEKKGKKKKNKGMDAETIRQLETERGRKIEDKIKKAFKENSQNEILNLKKNVNLHSSDLYKSDRELSVELQSGEIIALDSKKISDETQSKNIQTSSRGNNKYILNPQYQPANNFLPKINSRGALNHSNNQYSPRFKEEKYHHYSPQRELSKKLRKLERDYDQANNNANVQNVHERLHNEHVVREIILNEKRVLIEKYEETKWTMNLLDQGVILYDINGVTLVYDTDTSKTYLDIRKAVKNFKDTENKFDYEMLKRDPRPTYVTELNDKILRDVKKEFYEVNSFQIDSRNTNNYIPVEQMMDGEMGITLNSLSLVIHKIFNQIYGLKEKMDKKTQTNAAAVILNSIERRKKMEYLIRGVRGVRNVKNKMKRRTTVSDEKEDHNFPNQNQSFAEERQFMTEVKRGDVRGRSLDVQKGY